MHKNFDKKQKKNGTRAFTLVELLGTIAIIGILSTLAIVNVSKLITKARVSSSEANAKTMKMAAESYMQSNTSELPKSIGESKNIDVKILKNKKYIDKDLTDSKGKNCMTYSYVKVYKLSQSEYTYTPYLYCGDETPKNSEKGKVPVAVLSFSNSNDVSLASFTIKAYGDDTKKNGNYAPETAIDSFNYSISVKSSDNDSPVEVFNSGTLTANRKTSITINKSFSDFIDISSEMTFYIDVTVININGEIYTINSSNNVNYQKYVDNVKPLCVYKENGMAENEPEENSWINKKNYGNNDRVISVYCDDKDGSGCKRNKFSKSWPYDENGDGVISDEEKGVEYSYISIYDNFNKKFSGNLETGNRGLDTRGEHSGKEDCRVRVNVDLVSPSATLIAKSGNDVVLNSIKVNDGKETTTINATSYKNLVGTNEKWMNKKYYPNGVTYEVNVTDNLHLDHWKWETNASYLNKKSFNENISENNPDSDKGDFTQPNMNVEDKSNRKDKIVVGFKTEGMRYGVLTIYDAAGNSISYVIYANLDRTAPRVPTFSAKNVNSNANYDWNTWSIDRGGVSVYATGSGRDNLTNGVDLAGHKTYKYKYNSGKWIEGSTYKVIKQGKSTISFIACDHADNCSASTDERIVLYDTIDPVCTVTASAGGNNYNSSWINKDVTIKAECSDDPSGSGCKTTTFSKIYNYDLEVSNAGAVDVGNGGVVYDIAGNSKECKTVTVKRDTVAPNCTVSGGDNNWINTFRTVTATCDDNSGVTHSKCTETTLSYKYDSNINTITAGAAGNNSGGVFKDNAGNETTCLANQTVKVDTVAPKCKMNDVSSDWTKGSRTVTAECQDDFSGCVEIGSYKKKYSHTYSSEINTDYAGADGENKPGTVRDAAGNTKKCSYKTVKIDKTAPRCVVTGGSSKWTTSTVRVTATCYDDQGKVNSGCKNDSFHYDFSGTTNITNGGASGAGNGGSFTDKANNTVNCSANKTVKIDTENPKISSCSMNGTSISTSGVSDNASGTTIYYVFDRSSSTPSSGWSKSNSTSLDACSKIYGHVKVVDGAGNSVTKNCGSYKKNCNPYGKNNCNLRGSSIRHQSYSWKCTHGHTHNSGYTHYCTDSNGKLQTKDTNNSLVTYRWICPTRPYGPAQGWTIVPD